MEHDEHNRPSERLARVEVTTEHLKKQQDAMSKKLDEMYTTIQQLRGAKWSLLAVASVVGFVIDKILTLWVGAH